MDYIGGVDETMNWLLKVAYFASVIVVGFKSHSCFIDEECLRERTARRQFRSVNRI